MFEKGKSPREVGRKIASTSVFGRQAHGGVVYLNASVISTFGLKEIPPNSRKLAPIYWRYDPRKANGLLMLHTTYKHPTSWNIHEVSAGEAKEILEGIADALFELPEKHSGFRTRFAAKAFQLAKRKINEQKTLFLEALKHGRTFESPGFKKINAVHLEYLRSEGIRAAEENFRTTELVDKIFPPDFEVDQKSLMLLQSGKLEGTTGSGSFHTRFSGSIVEMLAVLNGYLSAFQERRPEFAKPLKEKIRRFARLAYEQNYNVRGLRMSRNPELYGPNWELRKRKP